MLMQRSTIGGFERLQEHVAHEAFHGSGERFDPPKCHPNTRVAIIKRITDWISGLNEDTREALIMWLYGAAGAGHLFFFSKNDPQRVAKSLVKPLVYQCSRQSFLRYSGNESPLRLKQDPVIVTRSLDAQFMAFVREPLERLQSGFSTSNHIAVIIDGLDECDDLKVQAKIIDLSFRLLHSRDCASEDPPHSSIASRPEIDISSSFDT
ncbi:hypothetical protein CVT25_005339 [Psilocybe cyanescens]|uniref:Nephrocystin 3-like N-terminal domain-containing protein n=1 Tax=Psilocybe cyanescens TaxID=93625 RepID=A0A409WWX7_PSICY|nr:hypothetical protein CVT25_005339 [Psilocybe cyanescens]